MFVVKTQKMHKNEICIQKSNKRYLFDLYRSLQLKTVKNVAKT